MMHCIIRKKSDAQKALMIELTLLTLLNYVGDNFCEYRNLGHDNYKSCFFHTVMQVINLDHLKLKRLLRIQIILKLQLLLLLQLSVPSILLNNEV